MVRKNWWGWLLLGFGLAGLGLYSADQARASHDAGISHYHTHSSNCDYRPQGQQGATFFRCQGATFYQATAGSGSQAIELLLLEPPGANAAPEVIYNARESDFWDEFGDDLVDWLEEDLDRDIGDISRDQSLGHTNRLLDQRLGGAPLEAVPDLGSVVFCLPFDLPARYYGNAFTNRVEPKEYQPPTSDNSGFEYLDGDCNRGLEDKTVFLFCHLFSSQTIAESLDYIPTCYLVATDRTRDPENPELLEDIEQVQGEIRQEEIRIQQQAVIAAGQTSVDPCYDDGGLNWLFCHVLEYTSNGVSWIEERILGLLRVDREKYTGDNCSADPGSADYDAECGWRIAWASVRNLMTLAIVGTALVMIIATALDFGWFSNYTVKKYLARLIAGTILIQLSWALGDFVITLANSLGEFIGGVITAPFNHSFDYAQVGGNGVLSPAKDIGLADIFRGDAAGYAGSATVGAGIAGAIMLWGGAVSLPVALLTILIGFLMFFAGFMFLVMRLFIIIGLLVISPLGVAVWLLPGSDKFWKLYYRTFLSLVMIYPAVVAVIAAGRSFIWVLLRSNDNNGFEESVVVLVAFLVYVGMYAAIPFIFKRGLGAINQLTGTSNNPAKGLIDRLRNARKGYAGRNKAFRRMIGDRRDDKALEKYKDASPLSWGGVRKGAIQARRSLRYGLPMTGVRPDVRDAIARQRQVERAKRLATEEGEAVQSLELDHSNDNDAIAQVARGIDPNTGQAVTEIYQEAAIKLLVKRKRYDILADLDRDRTASAKLNQAWSNLAARDAEIYTELRDVATGAAEAKVRKDQLEVTARVLGQQYGFGQTDELVALAQGVDPTGSGRAITPVEMEGAIVTLAERKQNAPMRQLAELRQNNRGLSQAWGNVANDGTTFKQFKEVDFGLATDQVGVAYGSTKQAEPTNFGNIKNEVIVTQEEPAIADMRTWLDGLRNSGQMGQAKNFVGRVDKILNNPYRVDSMSPVTHTQLTGLRDDHVRAESLTMARNLRGTTRQMADIAAGSDEGLDAEIQRQAGMRALAVSTEPGRNQEIRRLCRSTDSAVSQSLESLLRGEGFDTSKGIREPQDVNLNRGRLASMGPVAARVVQAQLAGNQSQQMIRADINLRDQIRAEVQAAAADANVNPETAAVLGEIDSHLNWLGQTQNQP